MLSLPFSGAYKESRPRTIETNFLAEGVNPGALCVQREPSKDD